MGDILSFTVKSKIISQGFVSEYSSTNAWNVNFGTGNVNNNNNKYNNELTVRPVSAIVWMTKSLIYGFGKFIRSVSELPS